jgi:nucleoside-diphosphate-sugar epimerase
MEAPSFNLRIVWALLGKFDAAVSFPIPWSLAADVAYASISALDNGVRGEKYLAFAGSHEVSTMAAFCNRACEIAGVKYRVNEITAADLDASEDVRQRVGPSLTALAHQRFPEPFFVNTTTVERLDYHPRPLDESLRETVEWLYQHDLVK